MDIAVHYKRFDLDEEKCFFIPTNIIFGHYDKDSEMFFSESGIVCYPINSKSNLAYDYFSSPTTIEELKNSFGEDLYREELLSAFLYTVQDNCYIGLINEEDITVLTLAVYEMESELISKGKCKHVKLLHFDGKKSSPFKTKKKTASSTSSNGINNINAFIDNFNKFEKKGKSPKLEWEVVTPYKVLGIDEKEYTKKELLEILSDRINHEQKKKERPKQKTKKIDSYLDAYNEIMKKNKE